jgi:hypothetical protein
MDLVAVGVIFIAYIIAAILLIMVVINIVKGG